MKGVVRGSKSYKDIVRKGGVAGSGRRVERRVEVKGREGRQGDKRRGIRGWVVKRWGGR